MRQRRSDRHFLPDSVDESTIRRLLEAAASAPSASNRQPYRFVVIRHQATKDCMAAAVADAARRRVRLEPERLGFDLDAYVANFLHFVEAPCVIVVLFRASGPVPLGEEGDTASELREGLSSASAAIMQLLLAAHALGLGSCWMTGPCVAEPAILELLGTPPGWRLAAVIPIGRCATHSPPPRRRKLEQLLIPEPAPASGECLNGKLPSDGGRPYSG